MDLHVPRIQDRESDDCILLPLYSNTLLFWGPFGLSIAMDLSYDTHPTSIDVTW